MDNIKKDSKVDDKFDSFEENMIVNNYSLNCNQMIHILLLAIFMKNIIVSFIYFHY